MSIIPSRLTKIDASQVVVADVTITGITKGQGVTAGKKLINSNVAIELGYAFHSRGDQNVILVLNAHYGAHKDLPFDLRHKGGAVVFDLPPDADQSRIQAEKKKLIAQFSEKLKPYLEAAITAAAPPFQETPPTYVKAAYFAEGEILAQIGEPVDLVEYFYDTKQLAYIRLIPTKGLAEPIPLAALREEASRIPLLRRGHGALVGHAVAPDGLINGREVSFPERPEQRLSGYHYLSRSMPAGHLNVNRRPFAAEWIQAMKTATTMDLSARFRNSPNLHGHRQAAALGQVPAD